MIRLFYVKEDGKLVWEKNPGSLHPDDHQKIIWIDLQSSTPEEEKLVEEEFRIELYTPQEAAEIESSSRYFEDEETIEANNVFIVDKNRSYTTDQVSFIIKKNILFTLRDADLQSFAWTVKKLKPVKDPSALTGKQVLLTILESQIDLDADFIEHITKLTTEIIRELTTGSSLKEDILIRISELHENTILGRESIIDKQRLVSSLIKSANIPGEERERLRIIIKDINSILQHTEYSFQRLDYLQNTFMGLVNIEQNKVIKIFTVVTVVFMPPTLIASIYGMNFHYIPELKWQLGYPFAIVLMLLSSLIFLWYFKKNKWL